MAGKFIVNWTSGSGSSSLPWDVRLSTILKSPTSKKHPQLVGHKKRGPGEYRKDFPVKNPQWIGILPTSPHVMWVNGMEASRKKTTMMWLYESEIDRNRVIVNYHGNMVSIETNQRWVSEQTVLLWSLVPPITQSCCRRVLHVVTGHFGPWEPHNTIKMETTNRSHENVIGI